MTKIENILIEIQDYLAPKLDPWEQMLYHYLFRHTYLVNQPTHVIAARSSGQKLGKARSDAAGFSRSSIPRKLRTLEEKGAIRIVRTTREGTEIEIFLPHQIPGLIPKDPESQVVDITTLDFYSHNGRRQLILERDSWICRYCCRKLEVDDAAVDHVTPQANSVGHTFRNLVASCFACNSRKQDMDAKQFLRDNYRRSLLSDDEFNDCLQYLDEVANGLRIPQNPGENA